MSWRWWQQWRERKLDDNDKTKNNNRKRNIIAHSIRRCGGINHANKRRHIDVSIAYIAVLRYEVKWGGKKDIFSSGLMNIELMSSSSSMWQQESQWKTASFTPHTFSTSAMSVCVRGPSAIWGRTCHQRLLPPPPHSLALLLLYVPTKLSDPCERTECYWLEINADNNNERSCIRWGEQNEELMLYSCWENIYTYISIADAWWHEWDDSTRRL